MSHCLDVSVLGKTTRKNRRVAARDKPPVNDGGVGVSLDVAQTIPLNLKQAPLGDSFFAEAKNERKAPALQADGRKFTRLSTNEFFGRLIGPVCRFQKGGHSTPSARNAGGFRASAYAVDPCATFIPNQRALKHRKLRVVDA